MLSRSLLGGFVVVLSVGAVSGQVQPRISQEELKSLVPPDYTSSKLIHYDFSDNGHQQYVAALTDSNADRMDRPITLLLIDWDGHWVVHDRYSIQTPDPNYPSTYLDALRAVTIGKAPLLYVGSHWWGGGSGSDWFFSFLSIRDGRFYLVKQFEHDRMMCLYLYIANNAIYDAVLVKQRGPKHGKSFVYTCYLDVTKYTYDGEAISSVASEKLRERTGNRFLDEQYWWMSLRNALVRGEAFQADFLKKQY